MLIENIEEFIVIEKRIDTAEDDAADTLRESIRDRWESGKWILTKRVGKQLPKDMIGELVKTTGKSERELRYRMQFAEQCPTEDKVCKRLQTCPDWYAVIKSLPNAVRGTMPNRRRSLQALGDLQGLVCGHQKPAETQGRQANP